MSSKNCEESGYGHNMDQKNGENRPLVIDEPVEFEK
jgi:hypothetical protein